jgi:hypothetical protein
MMQPIGSIVSTTSARPNSVICALTAAAFLYAHGSAETFGMPQKKRASTEAVCSATISASVLPAHVGRSAEVAAGTVRREAEAVFRIRGPRDEYRLRHVEGNQRQTTAVGMRTVPNAACQACIGQTSNLQDPI